jgi:hypothetical protein
VTGAAAGVRDGADQLEVVGDAGGPQPEPVDAGARPLLEQVGQLGRGTDEDEGVAAVVVTEQVVESVLAVLRFRS